MFSEEDAGVDRLIVIFTSWGEGPAGLSCGVNGHFGKCEKAGLEGHRSISHPSNPRAEPPCPSAGPPRQLVTHFGIE